MKILKSISVLLLYVVLVSGFAACGGGGSNSNNKTESNLNPVANAGPDQAVATGSLVALDGSASSSTTGSITSHSWSFASKPGGSTAALSDASIANPTFTADVTGSYILSLTVNNGTADSAADTVTITAFTPSNPIPDTGQTTSYTETFGEDSNYTIRPMSFTDNGDGTVTENITGLMWQQGENATYNWYEASGTYNATYNPTTTDICGSLTLAGHSDWRLPNEIEMISIINYGTNPAIDTTYFPNVNTSLAYWSSSVSVSYVSSAWKIALFHGETWGSETHDFDGAVRCVRGRQYSAMNFMDNGNGTVTDKNTGLMWQKENDNTKKTWEDAITYCEGLSLAGYSDWRLPNIKELRSIVDNTKYNPAIDTTYFPNTAADEYWSSTTWAYYTYNAWAVFFYNGNLHNTDEGKTQSYYARCVR